MYKPPPAWLTTGTRIRKAGDPWLDGSDMNITGTVGQLTLEEGNLLAFEVCWHYPGGYNWGELQPWMAHQGLVAPLEQEET